MALNIPPGFSQVAVELQYILRPKPWYVTFGVDAAPGEVDASGILTAFRNAWQSSFDTSTTIVGLQMWDMANKVAATGPYAGSAGAGTYGPPNCAVLLKKRTTMIGRRHRGRIFMPMIASQSVHIQESGQLDTAFVTATQTKCNTWMTALGTGGWGMTINHNDSALPPTSVVQLIVDPVIATQRRRLR